MIDTSAVRNKVLTLAFQGKLTTYNLSDDNVVGLYSQICKQRDELIRRKEIKKNKTKAIQDTDIVYELPANWMWVRLGEVINLQSGQDLPTVDYNDVNKGIPYITGASNFTIDGGLIINRWTEKPSAYAINGDILLSVKGTVGRLAILHENKVHIARQIMGIRPIGLNRDFVKYFIQAKIEELKSISKGLIPGIERDNVLNMLMPMPPIEEQKRIVSKVDDIYGLLDTIDIFQTQYSTNVEILRSKLIDAGIRGKLTEQLPEDGDAEALYNQIQDERVKHIKEGKIKKEKTLPEITEDEVLFKIPKNWKWVRMSEIIDVRDGTHDSPQYYESGIPMITSKNLSDGRLDFENTKFVSEEDAKKINERSFVDDGDILFAMIGTIGNPVLVKKEREFVVKNVALFKNIDQHSLSMRYVYWYLMREQYEFKKIVSGGLQPFISLKQFRMHVMPLPPFAEQVRIATKLELLLSQI